MRCRFLHFRAEIETTHTYDLKGNTQVVEAGTDKTTYTWDGENRLTLVEAGAARYTSIYDGDGLRRQWESGGTRTRYVWDGQDVLAETTAGGTTQVVYTNVPALFGELLSDRKSGASRFYLWWTPLSRHQRCLV